MARSQASGAARRTDAVSKNVPFALGDAPGHLIRRLQQVAISLFLRRVDAIGFDLTPVQYASLSKISSHPAIDQASLAALIAYDRTTIGVVVGNLERKGLVFRTLSKADRRLRLLTLTASGHRMLAAATPAVDEAQVDILAPFTTKEREQFMPMLKKLVHELNESSRAPFRPVDDALKQRRTPRARRKSAL